MTDVVDRIPAPVLQVWDAAGAAVLGPVAGVIDITVSEVLSETGSLAFSAPRNVAGVSLLDTDGDRQLCLHIGDLTPMWFLLDDDDSTWISDDPATEPVAFTCRSLHGVLDEAVIGPDGGIGAVPATWSWTSATPGRIVKDVFDAAQGRGMLQNLALDGTATLATVDAAGDAWPETLTVTHPASTTVLGVLTALRDAGLLEYRFSARTLQVYMSGGALDRSPDVRLRPRRDVQDAPLKRSRRTVATAVIVEGSGGETVRRTQALTGRRAREVYTSETDLDVGGAADAAGDLYLAAHAEADVQITHTLTDGDDSPRPWIDYRCGDRLITMAAGPSPVRRRVQQIALSMSATEVNVTLELGSILRTAEEQMARKIAKLAPSDGAIT